MQRKNSEIKISNLAIINKIIIMYSKWEKDKIRRSSKSSGLYHSKKWKKQADMNF